MGQPVFPMSEPRRLRSGRVCLVPEFGPRGPSRSWGSSWGSAQNPQNRLRTRFRSQPPQTPAPKLRYLGDGSALKSLRIGLGGAYGCLQLSSTLKPDCFTHSYYRLISTRNSGQNPQNLSNPPESTSPKIWVIRRNSDSSAEFSRFSAGRAAQPLPRPLPARGAHFRTSPGAPGSAPAPPRCSAGRGSRDTPELDWPTPRSAPRRTGQPSAARRLRTWALAQED